MSPAGQRASVAGGKHRQDADVTIGRTDSLLRRCRSQCGRPVLGAEVPPRPAGVLPSWRCVSTSYFYFLP